MRKPSARILKRLLSYNPSTGQLTWRERPNWMFKRHHYTNERETFARIWNSKHAGKPAFTSVNADGYHQGQIFKSLFRAHRVIACMMTGDWPSRQVDHLNGDRADNRWENLRLVSREQNMRNAKLYANNTSGVVGVCWLKRERSWLARIGTGKKSIVLGYFKEFDDAVEARKAAEIKYGYHKNHGRAA